MKFFFIAFAILTAISGFFWYTDGPGSGMGIPTGVFCIIAALVGLYNTIRFGGPLNEGPKQ